MEPRAARGLLMLLGAALLWETPGRAAEPGTRVVDYAGLNEALRGLRGRVILVDCWFEACAPCKREFHHLVELQDRHRAAGLATVALNLDDPADAEVMGRVRAFLAREHANGLNLTLAEPAEVWQRRMKVESLPCVFLFDRAGRMLTKWEDRAVDYAAIEARVRRALAETD